MLSAHDYGEIMPRWVAMMSVAMGTFIVQALRHRLSVLYPLGFFMPLAMMPGLAGHHVLSRDSLFLTLLAVVGFGVVLSGTSLWLDRHKPADGRAAEPNSTRG